MRLKPVMLLAALALPMLPAAASAQSSPKTVQIYVPFAPGGSADGIARIVATELSASLNRQFVIINQPGAGGTLGLITASKAPG
jgi:tripartite-type tricarboxylate transporter receptor subunit TctC